MTRPRRFRGPSLVHQLELIAFRGVPIIALISFLVGCIVAQQGIFQLRKFGATPFVVDLVGILMLRELGVLLTSIMVAGRSGSAFTAEIGSMKMREEIDALRVMGLDPIEVLIVPRLLALIIGLPLLTFLSDLAALVRRRARRLDLRRHQPGRVPVAAAGRRSRSTPSSSGIIKAPFMALVIGLIASIEGLAVEGSAESLGRHVTVVGREGDLHGDRRRRPLRHVLRGDPVLDAMLEHASRPRADTEPRGRSSACAASRSASASGPS